MYEVQDHRNRIMVVKNWYYMAQMSVNKQTTW